MKIKNLLAGVVATGALALGSQSAQAATICAGCEYGDDAGTYIGTYNPLAVPLDVGTFQHSDVTPDVGSGTPFEDFWVFDLNPGGNGSISADFTAFTAITGFHGDLFVDGGSTCAASVPPGPSDCSNIALGALLASADSVNRRWEIITSNLPAGRYIIVVSGTTNGSSAYTGQLAFVPEPGTLALLGFGLLGMGLTARRRGA